MPAPSLPFKTILELVLWNDLQSCRSITPDVISVIKMPSFEHLLYREQKIIWGYIRGIGRCSITVICLIPKRSLTDSAV
jgi:hypothetical protein